MPVYIVAKSVANDLTNATEVNSTQLIDADWCWLMLIDMLIDGGADWWCLILIDDD